MWSSPRRIRRGGLYDPAAAGYVVAIVEDGGLAGSYGALGLVKQGADEVVAL
jgi:hypothetical protein